MLTQQMHFFGAGQMAEAMIRATINSQCFAADHISCFDIRPSRTVELSQQYGILEQEDVAINLANADIIVLGVRPQDDLVAIAKIINQHAKPNATLISIIAGVTLQQLGENFGTERPIARIIPNTLTDTGLGYTGAVYNDLVDKKIVDTFVTSFGKVMHVAENMLDIFTGYGVAGINYVYLFIEALVDAGVLAGMPREQAKAIAYENLIGAVEMLNLSNCHPRQLLDINNSPAGVGINGLFELNQSNFAGAIQKSVLTQVRRTTELAKGK
ncbi:NAD(P)-binding domain-containing protein [Vibrio sp.]|nr:NAD(P)-binding domain-containing protein [Vibrio sp.]